MTNVWMSRLVAFAYQYQREAAPFVDMMKVFKRLLIGCNAQTVLDVGCGSGRLIQLLVDDLDMEPQKIVAVDVSKCSLRYARKNIKKFRKKVEINFKELDISSQESFQSFEDNSFDLITAGLSLQYAEFMNSEGQWSQDRYRNVYLDLYRILKPGGRLVFSTNVPNPDFSLIAKESKKVIFAKWYRTPLLLFVAMVMVRQGRELANMANVGRYHYLPIEQVVKIVAGAGFKDIEFEKTYAGLAWVTSCRK